MTEFDFDAELARMTAQTDQAAAGCKGLAGLLASFFRDLLSSGFERSEALELTRDYFGAVLDRAAEAE